MKTKALLLVFAALMAGFLTGCATPEARIKKNPEIFARLTPEQQELIKQGKVAIGFNAEMVQLALGEPDRVRTRMDADGATESWSYTTYEGSDGVLLYRGWYHRYYGGWGDPFYPYYLSNSSRREREYFKVVFKDGRVISIEQEKR